MRNFQIAHFEGSYCINVENKMKEQILNVTAGFRDIVFKPRRF